MMFPKHATLLLILGSLCLSGCATDPEATVMQDGYHRRLKAINTHEAAKISIFLLSTPYAAPETAPLTCDGIVRALNAQLTREGKTLRIRFEFSEASRERFLPQLANPLTTWQGVPLDEAQLRERLATASMSEVLNAVSAQLGLNLLWYSGAVILSDQFTSS